jgi:hypothetical protein
MAQAFAQVIVNVFNPKYKPRGSEEKDLFTLQLYYIYAIFCSNLKTDFRRKLVRDYESSQNAQAIWKELSNDAEKSTVAQLNATNLLQYTHTAQVENWKGTMLSFILHYQEQIRLYDQLQPPNEKTSDHVKMIYLQNAVYAIKELRSVQTTGSQIALANGTVPTYKDYKALLKLAASTYNQAHAPVKRQPTRSAERTDIWGANITESFHEAYEFGFDIDTPTDIVQAHMRNQLGVIRKETFGQLSPESRKAWSQLSDDVPVDILRALQANGSQCSQESCLARHHYVTNQGTTEHGYLRMLHSTGLYSSTLRTMMPLLHLLSRHPCMTPLQPVPLHQPIQTWMNKCMTFFLTSLVRHMQMGSRTSSSPVSQNRQQASTASRCNRRLRIFLQRIYVRCYPNVNGQTSHQS